MGLGEAPAPIFEEARVVFCSRGEEAPFLARPELFGSEAAGDCATRPALSDTFASFPARGLRDGYMKAPLDLIDLRAWRGRDEEQSVG